MFHVSALLFGLDAVVALAMGFRYATRVEFMPYQRNALGRDFADLDAGMQTVILAMLKVVGGGFLAYGVAALGLTVELWRGERSAGYVLSASAVFLLAPAYLAASDVARFAPASGAPTRLTLVAAAIAAAAFAALLVA